MSKVDIRYAALHGTIFVPGFAQHGPTLVLNAPGGNQVTKMTKTEDCLEIVLKKDNKTETVLIPLAMVTHMVPAKVDEKNSKASNKSS